jgi:ubiquitin-like 1-activating enzyme E1 A
MLSYSTDFLQRAEAAAPQVRKLNPRVKVNTYTNPINTETDASFYSQFDVIIATDLEFNSTNTLNLCARLANRPFYAGASHGLYGYIFADLIKHKFVVEREMSNKTTQVGPESSTRSVIETSSKKENGKSVETVTKQEIYSPIMAIKDSPLPPEIANNHRRLKKVHPLLTCVRALWEYQFQAQGIYPSHDPQQLQWFTMTATEKHKLHLLPSNTLTAEFLRSFLQNLGSELAPVTAFLGGQLAQDVINVLGQREQPIQNLMLFDGEESAGPVYALHPIFVDNPIAALPSIPMPVEAISIDD